MGSAAAARPRERRGSAPPWDIVTPRQGGAADSCSARAVCSRPFFVAALGALLLGATAAAAPPGTSISNRAEVSYVAGSGPATIVSNSVDVVVVPPPARAALTLLRSDASGGLGLAQPTQCTSSGTPLSLPPPLGSNGQPFGLGQALPLGLAATVHGGEAVFLELADADRNRDAALIDSVELTVTAAGGDRETLLLAETAVDSGRFAGYVQTRAAATALGDCTLQVQRDGELTARYADPLDPADTASAAAAVDPFGLVFDSQTGAPVDGARVRLVLASTGAPAAVRGDDGVSAYPAELVTGQSATDAGGTVYAFPPGVFRFPLVAAGDYRLIVEPPARYGAPSRMPEAQLQTLPGAPYTLLPASFGSALTVAGQIAPAVDIPLDPTGGTLFVEKTVGVDVAAIGDFVPYTVTVRNAAEAAALANVVITDRLPSGLRYQPGSARSDSAAVEPEISADGLTLTFRLPALEPRRSVALRYVAVVANGAAGSTLVNRAMAQADGGSESNTASAAVLLREELFSSAALLLGRVVAGTCGTTVDAGEGVRGVRIYLEDGRYAVTDDEGKYHFEGVTPGSHVVQLDTITLPEELTPLRCDTRVRSAGNATSTFVDLRGGALGTADFVVAQRAAPIGEARVALATVQAADRFEHTATVTTRAVPLTQAEMLVLLPDGLEYVAGSAALNGVRIADPEVQNGALRFALGEIAPDGTPRVTFATRGAGAPAGELTLQALLRFTTALGRAERTAPVANVVERIESTIERVSYTFAPRYNAYSFAPRFASLQTQVDPRDGAELERIAAEWRGMRQLTIEVVGHTDQTPIAARNRGRFPDNYALSVARAEAVAAYLQAALSDAHITIQGRGADEPVAPGTAPESLANNRRVEIHVAGVRTLAAADWRIVTAEATSAAIATTGVGEATVPRRALASARPAGIAAALEPEIDVATLEPQLAILQPSDGFAPPVPTMRVSVAHLPEQQVQLTVNGRRVSDLNFDGTAPNPAKTAALSRWRGVDLVAGDNRLVATVVDAAGGAVAVLERTVRYGGGGVRAELVGEESQLTADGRTQPVIALRVFDASGQPARPGTLGAYRVDPPYRTWWEVETLHDNPLLVESRREPTFAVEEDGLVRLLLEPTAQTGAAVVRLRFNERQEQELRVWLEPEQRDWILVGIAEGTTSYYDKLEDALLPPDADDGYSSDGRLAFFAKGRVKGSTLLTIAFDSERDRPLVEDRLFGAIEPDRYYTLYGDSVEQRFEAATTRKLYLKIERRQFAALFGDFETGFTITELGRYSRSLTGLKADYGGERFAVNAFAAENREQYGRDELAGDGTSGPYQLSRTALVANSERVRIEVRDRVRSEVVVESRLLTRFIDYSLDYFTGTLTLKSPVMSRDAAFNPIYVIAEYETLDADAQGTTAGARTTARLAGDKLELGATLIEEHATAGDTRLAGTDLRLRLGGALELRAELAQTASDDPLRAANASAYLAEVEHVTERLDVQAYVREQDFGFGVGQQLRTEAGTRKVGIDTRSALTELWTARGEAFRQTNLATGADRELLSAEARRETDDATASVGLKRVVDELPQSGVQRSELLSVGGSLDVLRDRVTLRALTEQSLGSRAASLDFPERTALGVDYHLSGATTLFAEVEDAEGALFDSTMTRIGVRSTPWSGSQLSSSVNREFSEHGPRVFANVGLTQSFKVGEAWAFDAGVDRSDTLVGATAERFNPNVPLVAGSIAGDFLATFVGAQYRADVWTITSRVERRAAVLTERWSFTSGFFREPIEGRALSVTTRWLDSELASGAGRTVDARVSYAFRPRDSKLIVLQRLDLAQDERVDPLTTFATTRFVNNVNLHWQFDNRFEFGTQLGARYVQSTIDGEAYSGWSTLLGVDLRRDLTRVLDFGVHGTRLDSEAGGTSERSFGVDVGLTSARNLWISIGYNFEGFRDEHFDASRYTADGPYVRFRFKIDQDTFRDLDLSGLRADNR